MPGKGDVRRGHNVFDSLGGSLGQGLQIIRVAELAESIKQELIEKCNARRVLINEMGSTMATYDGEGGMIISL